MNASLTQALLRRWLLCALSVLVLSPLVGVSAQSPGQMMRGYFVDPTGQMTLAEVKRQDFKPFGQALSLGYTSDTVWLRLRIDSSLRSDAASRIDSAQFVLRLTNPLLDDVRLFDPLSRANTPTLTGDTNPITQDERDLSTLTFLLPEGRAPRDIYVRVRSQSSLVFSVLITPVEEALKSNRTYDLIAGLYLGLLFVFFVLAISLRVVATADGLTSLFVVKQTLALVWSFYLLGYARQFLSLWVDPAWLELVGNWVIVLYTYAVCQFGLVFLHSLSLRRWARYFVYLPLATYVPVLGLLLLGQTRLALTANALLILSISFLGMLLVLFAVRWRDAPSQMLPRWLVTTFFVLFGVATPLATSVTLTIVPVVQNAFVGFFFTTALAGLLMCSLLLYRARALARASVATATALKLQQQRNEEQAQFLGMLAHEFKTPLSIIKMVVGSGKLDPKSAEYSENAIQTIDQLLERCLQAEALLDAPGEVNTSAMEIDALAKDVISNAVRPERIKLKCADSIMLHSDPMLVRVILANLIDNAIKYGDSVKPILLEIQADSARKVNLRITNYVGRAGVPDPDLVFDKYYRSEAAKHLSGSGLGLYLASHIARMLGGQLAFEHDSELIHFMLELPRRR